MIPTGTSDAEVQARITEEQDDQGPQRIADWQTGTEGMNEKKDDSPRTCEYGRRAGAH